MRSASTRADDKPEALQTLENRARQRERFASLAFQRQSSFDQDNFEERMDTELNIVFQRREKLVERRENFKTFGIYFWLDFLQEHHRHALIFYRSP